MQPKKHYFAHIPTIAIFIVFAMSAPLGVLLFILKSIDKNAEKEEKAAAQAQADYRSDLGPASAQMAPRQEQDPEAACGTDRPTAEQKSAQNWHKTIAVICTILGAVFLFTGAEELIDCLFDFPDFDDLLPALATTIGGAGALWTGLRMDRTRKLERLLDKIAGDRDNIPLDELFAAAGIDAAKGRAAVESAISHGYFGADAYIDNRTATLVVRGAAPQPPKQPEPKPAPEPADQYAALLQQLRQVNDAIPDPVMTTKISRLEAVSARIFELAKQDPGKKAQLQKFMDYYLPTALKLLNTYASLPAQDVQGENIADAKKNIERSMDLLVTAFENQLDKLPVRRTGRFGRCGRTGRDAEHGRPDRKRVYKIIFWETGKRPMRFFPVFSKRKSPCCAGLVRPTQSRGFAGIFANGFSV